jgi:hypothetical protein
MISKRKTDALIGKTVFYTRSGYSGGVSSGEIIKLTPKFCVMRDKNGDTKRKSKHLVFETEDDVKLDIIKKVNEYLGQFDLSILELGGIFKDMLDKYPEKFV